MGEGRFGHEAAPPSTADATSVPLAKEPPVPVTRRASTDKPVRLLTCSDTHDRLPPDLAEAGATAWLHAGDVYEAPDLVEAIPGLSDNDHPDVDAWARRRSVPVYTVKGNHDYADPFGFFTAQRDITGRVVRLADGLLLAGVGWAGVRSVEPPLDGELAEVCAEVGGAVDLARREGDRVVLLTHYPPRSPGLFPDDQWGRQSDFCFPCVTELVKAIEPVLVIQGHIHRWAGMTATLQMGERSTLVVSPGPAGMVIELRGRQASVVATGAAR